MKPRVLVLRAAGTNCDEETAFAFSRYGARTETVHVNALLAGRRSLGDYDALALPGGFSYGDDVAAGKVLALELARRLADDLLALVDRGGLILGVCNGFQVLVRLGLLPGLEERIGRQEVTLIDNDSDRYEDRWVELAVHAPSCPFLRGVRRFRAPVAHAEGKYVPRDEVLHARLLEAGRVALRYSDPDGGQPRYPANPNGSFDAVAGLVDATGRVLGLMPHPERALFLLHHPDWPRRGPVPSTLEEDEGEGAALFRNAVETLAG